MSEISEEQARRAMLTVLADGTGYEDVDEGEYRQDVATVVQWAEQQLSRINAERIERAKSITAERLESIGFRPDESDPKGYGFIIYDLLDDMEGDDPHFQILVSDQLRSIWLDCYDGNGDSLGLCEIGKDWTRGQLEDLIAALKGGGA